MKTSSNISVHEAYAKAVAAAEVLRKARPGHELLRLVRKDDPNLEQTMNEIIGRFYDAGKSFQDEAARSVIETICYQNLAKAMLLAAKGVPKFALAIEKFRIGTNEFLVDMFLLVVSTGDKETTAQMTFRSRNELAGCVRGIETLARLQGLEIDIPEIPSGFVPVPVDLAILGSAVTDALGLK